MCAKKFDTLELKTWTFEFMIIWNFEWLQFWHVETLKLWNFVFSTKGIPSTPQHTDAHPCTRPDCHELRCNSNYIPTAHSVGLVERQKPHTSSRSKKDPLPNMSENCPKKCTCRKKYLLQLNAIMALCPLVVISSPITLPVMADELPLIAINGRLWPLNCNQMVRFPIFTRG